MNILPRFTLDNFEGPLELLLYLIQKEEIDVCGVEVKQLTNQLMQSLEEKLEVDINSETLISTATLLHLKSQKLLPQDGDEQQAVEEDPRLEMIHNLIEYCRFKEMAKDLTEKEEKQKNYFVRPAIPFEKELGPGIEELDLETLKAIFQQVMQRAQKHPDGVIKGEVWTVADKIEAFKKSLKETAQIPFSTIFSDDMEKQELIVAFLAMLELMKHQQLRIVRETENLYIIAHDAA